MKKTLIAILITLAIVGAAYAQSPWGEWIRSPEDVRGLRADVDALKAENAALRAAVLALLYDKQLVLASNKINAASQPDGWGPFVYDVTTPDGWLWIPRDDYIAQLDATQIPQTDAHIAALEALTP